MHPAPWSFSWEPLFLALALAAGYAYVRAARRDRPSRARMVVFGLGLALVVAALCSPLETIARHYLLLIHLLGNVMIADWAPPLLVLGLTPSMRAAMARRGGRALALVTQPWISLPVWLGVWYLVHLPAFYDFALRHAWALNAEHALLIAATNSASDYRAVFHSLPARVCGRPADQSCTDERRSGVWNRTDRSWSVATCPQPTPIRSRPTFQCKGSPAFAWR